MKIKFLYIITLLFIFVSCKKENNTKTNNPLSGKVKRITVYDSLNTMNNFIDYMYNPNDSLYMLKYSNGRILFTKNRDTIMLKTIAYDSIANDSVSSYQYAYLNNQNRIYKIETVPNTPNPKMNYGEYLTDANGILMEANYADRPDIYRNKIYDVQYTTEGYTAFKEIIHFYLPPPLTIVFDTVKYNITYSNINNNTQLFSGSEALFETYFSLFGYRIGIAGSKMPEIITATNETTTLSFSYTLNTSNQIIEIKSNENGRLQSRSVIEYY